MREEESKKSISGNPEDAKKSKRVNQRTRFQKTGSKGSVINFVETSIIEQIL